MEIDDIKETIGFRLRLQIRLETLGTNEVCLTTRLAGREVTIRSRQDGQPISKAKWIVLGARGFATEPEARAFGERLRANVQLAALCSQLGADTGLDKVLSWINEDWWRSMGRLAPHQRSAPDVHGLSILPDDDNTLIPYSEPQVTKTSNPDLFLDALHELAEQPSITEPKVTIAVQLLNLARINPQPLARIVLAFSAVETVAQVENRRQRISVRQRVKRVLCRNSLSHLHEEWGRLYDLRSHLFHGSKQLAEQEVNSLANDALNLCSRIILAIIKRNGVKLPPLPTKISGVSDV
ncbi:MAG: hypothetical protein OXH16_12530 [Gemmatimonadetes bacterium]|nr:hypothetical protein [Gemmatimonadota bacterium]